MRRQMTKIKTHIGESSANFNTAHLVLVAKLTDWTMSGQIKVQIGQLTIKMSSQLKVASILTTDISGLHTVC